MNYAPESYGYIATTPSRGNSHMEDLVANSVNLLLQEIQLPDGESVDLRESEKIWTFIIKSRAILPLIRNAMKRVADGGYLNLEGHSLRCYFQDPTVGKNVAISQKFLDVNKIPRMVARQFPGEVMVTQECHQHHVDNYGRKLSCSG